MLVMATAPLASGFHCVTWVYPAQHRLSDLDKLSLIGISSEHYRSVEKNVEIESIYDTQYRQLAKSTTCAM